MTNTQLAAFIIGVAITVVIVGAVLVILFALRGFRNNRTRGGVYPGFEHGSQSGQRELAEGLSSAEPAPLRVVEWTPPQTGASRRLGRPAPAVTTASEATAEGAARQESAGVVASAPPPPPPPPSVRTEGDVSVVTSEGRREIVLDEPENTKT